MSDMYPPMAPPYGFKLKRPHFTYHEMNGGGWAECAKHDNVYHKCLDSGGFDVGSDCVGCVIEERIIKLLQHEYLEMPGLEYEHFEDACVTCENIALIKGEK